VVIGRFEVLPDGGRISRLLICVCVYFLCGGLLLVAILTVCYCFGVGRGEQNVFTFFCYLPFTNPDFSVTVAMLI
jgi:hypothetical protein